MSDLTLVAEARTEFGKGAARRIRRADRIPAVLYGHGTDPLHVSLPGHATFLALKVPNAVLTIKLDGDEQLALVKDVQRDPVRQVIEHVDLLLVRKGEKVQVDVALSIVGEPAPGTMHLVEANTIAIEAEATNLPESIEFDITGLEAGTIVHARDLVLPAGVELLLDADADLINISDATVRMEEETDAGEAAEAPAEGGGAEGAEDSE